MLVPLGSTEQHGPHLPFATDSVIAEAAARSAAPLIEAGTGRPVVIAPALPYGASGEHQSFPGTVSIGHDALRLVLIEMIRSLSDWAGLVVLVNGHGGNQATVTSVAQQMRDEQHDVLSLTCALESASDAHAGHDETSVLLHLAPSMVRMDDAEPGNTDPLDVLLPELMRSGVRPVSPNGVLGDPTESTAHTGRQSFEGLVNRLAQEVCHH